MASQTRSAGLGQSIARGGGASIHWGSPTNIYTSNNQYSTASLDQYESTHWLRATNFGFDIPEGATIDGIVARIEKKATGAEITDASVKIVKSAVEVGDEKRIFGNWPLSDTYVQYGGVADLWGLTWTVDAINFGFGVSIAALYAGEWGELADVDHIEIIVYYTEAVGTNMKIKASGAWKDGDELKIKVGGAWKPGVKAWQKVSGAWKVIF